MRKATAFWFVLCVRAFVATQAQTQEDRKGPARFVVFPGSVASHWAQSKIIITELSRRGHKIQVTNYTCREAAQALDQVQRAEGFRLSASQARSLLNTRESTIRALWRYQIAHAGTAL